ncbi:GntR family transcriptional regulator [Collibacillus ludicampi]|uniref:GntR family transcriptional regulator n=1 Tax=Collibacillus ludicampi TaxID=2771369 RepID=A0AAV4LCY6_9BACL|nr:GntR family transcriptional regulator [Collibacillus ludicampi]GIM45616.1 GntR family transcriptional regulator [Collibacillus ludicampi]
MDLKLPSPVPLRIQAYNILKEAIISGVLKENEMITERRAQEQFHISRTPFREAIQTLEAEGWMYTIPYKGTYVSPITAKEIEDIFELRLILETSVVRKVQSEIDNQSLNRLEALVTLMETEMAKKNIYQFIILDRDFHRVLYELANNDRLLTISEQISDMMRRIGVKALHSLPRWQDVIKEHRKIIEGLREGRAEEAIIDHLKKTEEEVKKTYEE